MSNLYDDDERAALKQALYEEYISAQGSQPSHEWDAVHRRAVFAAAQTLAELEAFAQEVENPTPRLLEENDAEVDRLVSAHNAGTLNVEDRMRYWDARDIGDITEAEEDDGVSIYE